MIRNSISIETADSPPQGSHSLSLASPSDQFHTLVQTLSDVLGPSSGINAEDVDPEDLIRLMSEYTSNEVQWISYAFADSSRNYTRNLVDEGNGKSNLLIVVWNPGKRSPIHDHANAHCVMKILKGSLRETLYVIPEDMNDTEAGEVIPLEIARQTTYYNNEVTYISDQIGLHKIENASQSELAVSLHLYTPPHAANFGFNLFDEKTGKCTHIKQAGSYSDRGELIRKAQKVSFEKCGF